jgi:predicted acyltransferase
MPEKNQDLQKERILSIDVFRGATIAGMILVINPGSWKYIYPQLRHADWHGLTFTDLIYPFFLFIVGMSIVFAFSKAIEKNMPNSKLYYKIIKRTIILFVIGLFLNSFPKFDIVNIRIMGVLQRIAVCYLIVSIIYLHTSLRGQIFWTVSLLLIYWAVVESIPVPGVGAGHYEKYNNFATYFDRFFLSGHMGYYEELGEPEGIVSTLPSISSTLFGVLTAQFLRMKDRFKNKQVVMLLSGIILTILGAIWGFFLPVNKHLWTSSYVLVTAGLALVVYAILYYLIDVKKVRCGIQPFIVFGSNAITVYVLSIVFARVLQMITFTTSDGSTSNIKLWLYQNIFSPLFGDLNGSLAYAITYILFWYGIMWIFYERRIFIKI